MQVRQDGKPAGWCARYDPLKLDPAEARNREPVALGVGISASTEVRWARFYDLEDNRPLFPGRDGVVYDPFNEMAKHNELGYDYYSTRPSGALGSSQRKWRKRLAD